MLKVSTRGEYGSRMLVCLARHWGERPVALSEVAAQERLSVEYLEQLAVSLRKAGLIESHRGVHGGYTLSRPPTAIRMGDALRALEGPIAPMVCVSESAAEPVCEFESHCSTRLMWLRVGQAIAQTLDGMTLADLVPAPRERQPTIYVLSNGMGEAPEGLEKGIHAHHG